MTDTNEVADLRARLAAVEERAEHAEDLAELRAARITDVETELAAVTAERDAARRDLRNTDCIGRAKLREAEVERDEMRAQRDNWADAAARAMDREEAAEQQRDTARAALRKARTFIEYARYELEPGPRTFGTQFPTQVCADEELARIDAALSAPEGRCPDDDPGPECSICRRPGRHTHACE